jgi:hypothetical protein
MNTVFRVRDVLSARTYELGPEASVLRVPYDLFQPDRPVEVEGGLVQWVQGAQRKSGRVIATKLGETHPGERVLVHAPGGGEDWSLCEVEGSDGGDPA